MHAGQLRAWDSQARFLFVLAGTQSGKTSWGPWWLYREINRLGAGDYLAVTATYDLFNLKMLPELLAVFTNTLKIGRYWPGLGVIELKDPKTGKFLAKRSSDSMWGRIILRSASAEGGLESATARAAWLDECGQDGFGVAAWEAVQRRLSLAQGRVLGTTTPYNLGWVKTEVYDKWAANDPDYDIVQFASVLNPKFPMAEFQRAERMLPRWKFLMFYKGQFAKPPGMIYSMWDESVHVIDPFPIPAGWPRYVGLDPGGVHQASIWLAETPDGQYIAYRETLEGDMISDEHVQRMLDLAAGENVVMWTGGAPSEGQFRRDWTAKGLHVMQPSIGDVEGGLDRVAALLKSNRLLVFRTCTGLRDEFGKYSRVLDGAGEPTPAIKDKNTFHRLDALRYVAVMVSESVSFDDIGAKEMTPSDLANMWGVLRS